MAFESLTERLQSSIKKMSGQSTLTNENMEEMLREIRLALLEADVNFKVIKIILIHYNNNYKSKQ